MKLTTLCLLAIGGMLPTSPLATKPSHAAILPTVNTAKGMHLQLPSDNLGDFQQLVPVALLNPKSKKISEKYGIEFQGNCYDCDLASFHLTKKRLEWINVCNPTDRWIDELYTYKPMSDGILITSKNTEFRFTKVESIPVYELKVSGDKLTLKNKRFSKFYTTKEQLRKFKQHDCGEFDG
ncbi:MAG: hypothetical protein KGO82_01905 [Bacteroidota bacterium]|nr:hypothetical protein [Bacteroidota bacterium]